MPLGSQLLTVGFWRGTVSGNGTYLNLKRSSHLPQNRTLEPGWGVKMDCPAPAREAFFRGDRERFRVKVARVAAAAIPREALAKNSRLVSGLPAFSNTSAKIASYMPVRNLGC